LCFCWNLLWKTFKKLHSSKSYQPRDIKFKSWVEGTCRMQSCKKWVVHEWSREVFSAWNKHTKKRGTWWKIDKFLFRRKTKKSFSARLGWFPSFDVSLDSPLSDVFLENILLIVEWKLCSVERAKNRFLIGGTVAEFPEAQKHVFSFASLQC
jgi:hypothetical protein